jgi:hypothetical protein
MSSYPSYYTQPSTQHNQYYPTAGNVSYLNNVGYSNGNRRYSNNEPYLRSGAYGSSGFAGGGAYNSGGGIWANAGHGHRGLHNEPYIRDDRGLSGGAVYVPQNTNLLMPPTHHSHERRYSTGSAYPAFQDNHRHHHSQQPLYVVPSGSSSYRSQGYNDHHNYGQQYPSNSNYLVVVSPPSSTSFSSLGLYLPAYSMQPGTSHSHSSHHSRHGSHSSHSPRSFSVSPSRPYLELYPGETSGRHHSSHRRSRSVDRRHHSGYLSSHNPYI